MNPNDLSLVESRKRWDKTAKGRRTRSLIPRVESCNKQRHGNVCYDLTQFLGGYGGYGGYLHRFDHDDSSNCPICEYLMEHVPFHSHDTEQK